MSDSEENSTRKKPKSRPLFVVLLLIFAATLLGFSLWQNGLILTPPNEEPSPEAPRIVELPEINFEELDSRVTTNLPYFRDVESAALEAYDAANPPDSAWYQNGRIAVQLFIHYLVEGDFYGEGIFQNADRYSQAAYQQGCRDPLIISICDNFTFHNRHSSHASGLRDHLQHVQTLQTSRYPILCKFSAALIGLKNFVSVASAKKKPTEEMQIELTKLPEVFAGVMAQFTALVKTAPPDRVLYNWGTAITDQLDRDPHFLPLAGKEIVETLQAAGISGEVIAACEGEFLTEWAWSARGSGWANTVTPEGWRLMAERLKQAEITYETAFKTYPQSARIAALMITVELGQGKGLWRMNEWFEKAIAINPGYYWAYKRKMYYLQPRWYGSPEEVLTFGLECLKTERWSDLIPLVLIQGVDGMADQDESLYANEKIWELVSGTYSEFLKRYPTSIGYRTDYLEWAVKAKKWKVAAEQVKILGEDWDRLHFDEAEYSALKSTILNNS